MAASATSVDDPSLRLWLLTVVSAMAALSVIFVILRIISRHLMQQKLWHDDRLIISSAACNLIIVGLVLTMYSQGLGLPSSTVSPTKSVIMGKVFLAAKVVYMWNLTLTKLATLFMYYRILAFSRGAHATLVSLGAFVIVWSGISTLLFIFTCEPVHKLWFPDAPGHCIDQVGRWVANAASSIFTDMAIIILPIPQLLRLRLSRTDKLWLALVFTTGLFVLFASVYRFALLFSYSETNASYTLAPTIGWFEIELAAGIVAANLPILKPLVDRLTTLCRSDEQLTTTTTFFSGGSWGRGWRSGSGLNTKKLWPDRGSPSMVSSGCSAADAWDWSRCVEGSTRTVELARNQHRATASRGSDIEMIEVPLYGISVTKDFRRWSMVDKT